MKTCNTRVCLPDDSFVMPTSKVVDNVVILDYNYDLQIFGTPDDYEIQNLVSAGVPINPVPFENMPSVPDDSLFDSINEKLDDEIIVNPNSDEK